MKDYLKELQQQQWQRDIDSFARWKKFLIHITTPTVRARVIGYLEGIQRKWPKHININEIPKH